MAEIGWNLEAPPGFQGLHPTSLSLSITAIVRPLFPASKPLERILQSWKRHSSAEINALVEQSGTFWQEESYDRIIRDEEHLFPLHSIHWAKPNVCWVRMRNNAGCGFVPRGRNSAGRLRRTRRTDFQSVASTLRNHVGFLDGLKIRPAGNSKCA